MKGHHAALITVCSHQWRRCRARGKPASRPALSAEAAAAARAEQQQQQQWSAEQPPPPRRQTWTKTALAAMPNYRSYGWIVRCAKVPRRRCSRAARCATGNRLPAAPRAIHVWNAARHPRQRRRIASLRARPPPAPVPPYVAAPLSTIGVTDAERAWGGGEAERHHLHPGGARGDGHSSAPPHPSRASARASRARQAAARAV